MSGAALGRIALEIDGEGPPIVFLHGLGATSSAFQPLLDSLHGFRCIRPDLPGSGRSERPLVSLSMDALVRSALDIIRMVAGAPAHLVAHSMGTLVAQHAAVAAPEMVLSLTLFGPIGEPTEAARARLRERARLVRQDGTIAVADAIAAAGLSTSTKLANPVAFAYVRESHLRQDGEGFAQSCEALAAAKGADLRALKCAALLVTGEDDPVAPPGAAQALADQIRGAKLRVLARCGHWTPLEQPTECARLASEHIQASVS
jgi:pimeloyl-ACP methyl ester carboxylesterase